MADRILPEQSPYAGRSAAENVMRALAAQLGGQGRRNRFFLSEPRSEIMVEHETTWTPIIYTSGQPIGGIAVGVPVALPSESTEDAAMASAKHAMSCNPDVIALTLIRN